MKRGVVWEADWAQLAERIAGWLGLHFPRERRADLERGVAAAAQDLRLPDAAAFVRTLLAAAPERGHVELLARHLTIGETYFFRDRAQLDALAGALQDLARARRGHDQRLRIWSAGCSGGEEAYTLAILVHQLLPDLAQWQVRITGTDVNPAALRKAASGIYGDWSFRGMEPGVKAAYFERLADGRHAVVPQLRRLVRFECLNLAQDDPPPPDGGSPGIDVVLCRNVLMYFTPVQAERVIGKLHGALAPGGWLAVSPAETSMAVLRRFEQVNFGAAFLFRKGSTLPSPLPLPLSLSLPLPLSVSAFAPAAAQAPAKRAAAAVPVASARPHARPAAARPAPAMAQQARDHADAGRLAEALAACELWIAADKVDPAAHYLRAVVQLELGELEQADQSLRRALFVAPDFVLAHFALGNLARRRGRGDDAVRHFANAQALLARLRPGDLLPEGEGLSAGRLLQTIAMLLEVPAT